MSYIAIVSFDIKNGSTKDYENVYKGFETIGLKRIITSDNGKNILLPTTTTAGQFSEQTAVAVRDDLCTKTEAVFTRNGIHGEIFIAVGGDWAWSHRNP